MPVSVLQPQGPLFFGSVEPLMNIYTTAPKHEILVIDMSNVTMIDLSGVYALEDLIKNLKSQNIKVFVSSANSYVKKALEKISAKTKGKILNRSFDVKDFDISFVKGLSLEDGAATLTEYTSKIIVDEKLFYLLDGKNVLISGGGRKNKFLIKRIEANSNYQISLKLIDEYGVDGDFIESQAFAYLAIRSYLKLPISFPETTGVRKPCIGGIIIEN